jgi:hypothetical protein
MHEGSYQRRWQIAHGQGRFSKSMIEIADNIQIIHNSLASAIPPNALSVDTEFIDPGDFPEDEGTNDNIAHANLLANIAGLFAMTSGDAALTEETSEINRKFCGKVFKSKKLTREVLESTVLNSVIQLEHQDDLHRNDTDSVEYESRFYCDIAELNTLAMQQLLRAVETQLTSEGEEPKYEIDATGSWQSVVKWGINAQMDSNQQSAFEILVSTYLLTFHDEATNNFGDTEDETDFNSQKDGLIQLSRRGQHPDSPLRMFVTGGAGSGKCK